jgi:phosphatidylethanolamine-binding protein (PEBP) family uncharacterized protein
MIRRADPRSPRALVAIGLGALLVVGCGSGGSSGTGSGGTSGSAGVSGAAGSSGAAGTSGGGAGGSAGGTSGSAGVSGGTAGTAGGNTGGTAGSGGGQAGAQAGSNGQAGSAGQAGHGAGGAAAGTTGGGGGPGSGGQGGASGFTLTSPTLTDGAAFPTDATCDTTMASSQFPGVAWTGAPAGTMGFALALVDTSLIDLTPPNANGFHWVMWDIPAGVTMLPQGLPAGSPPAGLSNLSTAMQKKAPSGDAYLGPCPNFPSTAHTKTDNYELRLYALSQASLPSNLGSMTVQQIVTAIEALPPLGRAVLTGHSDAASTSLK